MKVGRFRSLAFKLTIWYIVILGIIIAISGTFLYEGFKKGLMADTDEELREIAEGVNTAWRQRGVSWEEALRKAEEEFRAHDPFLQAVKLAENGGGAVERIFRTGKIPPAARQKGIEFKMQPSSPSRIRGDRTLLERLLTNLVDNAVRYTPAGGNVFMSVEERGPWLVLTVRDTGIGIPEDSLPHIFDRFYVVDPSRFKESGGSGLGLSIVKSVADIHGAVIEVRSRVEEGTTFTIKFPLKERRV